LLPFNIRKDTVLWSFIINNYNGIVIALFPGLDIKEGLMKVLTIVFLSIIVMVLIGFTVSRADVVVGARVNLHANVNFSELNDYGEWVIVPGYGTVWRPDADPGWRPFTYGHWVYTNDGWLWDSDEPFGWVVCHYGNWAYDDDQGWVWLPGYEWSPARVRWHVTDNEIGWAPLFPEPRHGYHQNAIQLQWTFAPLPFFTSVEVRHHIAFRDNPAPGGVRVRVSAGPPPREFVQRSTGTPIVSIALNKVRVTTREHPLIKVEVRNRKHPAIETPVGPKYKRVKTRGDVQGMQKNEDKQNDNQDNNERGK